MTYKYKTMKNKNNPLNATVNYFKNHTDQNPTEINLYDFLTDGWFKEQVLALRQATDPTEQRRLKDSLPACTISGLFASRSADSLTAATHLICIDIDAKDNPDIADFDTLKEQIKACPYILFCGLSARGKGYFCIIQIADHKKFLGHFLSLERDFRRAGIVIDNSCKNINRLRYASYDPEPCINLTAIAYDRIVETPKRAPQAAASGNQIRNAYRLGVLTDSLNKAGKDITEQYQEWFMIACAIANEFKEAGRPMFHQLSKNYVGYTSSRADLEYDKALRHQYGNISFEAVFRKYFPKMELNKTATAQNALIH